MVGKETNMAIHCERRVHENERDGNTQTQERGQGGNDEIDPKLVLPEKN